MSGNGKFDDGVERGSEGFHQNQHASIQASGSSRVESSGEAVRERVISKEKTMPKSNTAGASEGSEHDAELRPASKGSSRPVEFSSVNKTPPRCSVQHVKNEVKDNNLSRKLYKQKQEKVDAETTYVHSTSPGGSTAKSNITKLMYPKKHGKRSARTRGKNSTLWTGVPMTDTAAANALVQTTVPPQQGKVKTADNPTIISGFNLDTGAENFDLSSAESCLASLYGRSERDLSIKFAVKLLIGETPLPKEAAEIEEFFSQKMKSEKSTKPGSSESQ